MPAFGNWPCSGSAGRPSCSSRARLEQLLQVDAGGEAHAFQHEHQVLGHHVAGGAGRVRAAAQTRQAGIEGADALLQPGQRVGDAEAAGVVQMQAVQRRADRLAGGAHHFLDLRRMGVADGVGQHDLVHAGIGEALGTSPPSAPSVTTPSIEQPNAVEAPATTGTLRGCACSQSMTLAHHLDGLGRACG